MHDCAYMVIEYTCQRVCAMTELQWLLLDLCLNRELKMHGKNSGTYLMYVDDKSYHNVHQRCERDMHTGKYYIYVDGIVCMRFTAGTEL